MKRAYIAGALSNPDVCKYISNCHKMGETAEQIRKLGVAVYVPYIDILMGLQHGNYEYNDYFDNSQPWLDSSDFVYLTPQWEGSTGTRREIERATLQDIPVFDRIDQVKEFIKPVIVCIVGESGSGKTLMAELFEQLFGYNLIQSYTTRQRRTPAENGHTFISNEQFDEFISNKEEMIAQTQWGDVRYCCLRKDVKDYNTYVIDEHGLKYLWGRYGNEFTIFSIRVRAKESERILRVGAERVERDKGKFKLEDEEFSFMYWNEYNLKDMIDNVEDMYETIHYNHVNVCLEQ
jgi:guanylate kinase